MKFKTEAKGNNFLVVNETTGYVKGRFRTKGEADVYCEKLQKEHNDGIERASSRLTPPDAEPREEE